MIVRVRYVAARAIDRTNQRSESPFKKFVLELDDTDDTVHGHRSTRSYRHARSAGQSSLHSKVADGGTGRL